jgi:hypothetical protein
MAPRAGRSGWVGAVLAVAAGLSLAAPRAAADCATHMPHFGGPLPFAADSGAWAAPHKEPVKRSDPAPRRCPCQGPNCGRLPADPTPPPPAPQPSSPSQDGAWVQAAPPPRPAAACDRAEDGRLLAPLCSPAPLERPPR